MSRGRSRAETARDSIVVVGVESTGKTTLAGALARMLERPLVPEIARDWLAARNGHYEEADLLTLAELQADAEAGIRSARGALVADTDLVVLRVWSEVRFGRCDARISARLEAREPAIYLLPRPDLPWEADPLRATPDPDERRALHGRYRTLLDALGHPWAEIGGEGPRRLAAARDALAGFGVSLPV